MTVKLGIIGGGNMGSAIVRGCLRAKVVSPQELVVAEVDAERRRDLEKLGVRAVGGAREATEADHVLLAVKPQVFESVAAEICPLGRATFVISIMAGIRSGRIRKALGGEVPVIRAMPNVACQIGAGMTALALGEGATLGDEEFARSIFSAMGRVVMVDESLMYAATAVSASGLAYVFLLAEAMEHAAVKLGFDQPTARALVCQTVLGAGQMLVESGQSAPDLRHAVTSPAGTTAAALKVLRDRGLEQAVVDAIAAATERGVELGRAADGSA